VTKERSKNEREKAGNPLSSPSDCNRCYGLQIGYSCLSQTKLNGNTLYRRETKLSENLPRFGSFGRRCTRGRKILFPLLRFSLSPGKRELAFTKGFLDVSIPLLCLGTLPFTSLRVSSSSSRSLITLALLAHIVTLGLQRTSLNNLRGDLRRCLNGTSSRLPRHSRRSTRTKSLRSSAAAIHQAATGVHQKDRHHQTLRTRTSTFSVVTQLLSPLLRLGQVQSRVKLVTFDGC